MNVSLLQWRALIKLETAVVSKLLGLFIVIHEGF
jgi:hypothetical protein